MHLKINKILKTTINHRSFQLGSDLTRAIFLGAGLPRADFLGGRFAQGQIGKGMICPAPLTNIHSLSHLLKELLELSVM